MEEVPGIPGGVPPLVLYPEANIAARLRETGPEWETYLDSWLFSLEFRLCLQDEAFSQFKLSQPASGIDFILSFLRSDTGHEAPASKSPKERLLFKRIYLLLRRLLLVTHVPFDDENGRVLDLLELASAMFVSVADWKATMNALWARNQKQLTHAIEDWKKRISKDFAAQLKSESVLFELRQMNSLVKVSAETGVVLLTGSDYLEALVESYDQAQATPNTTGLLKVLTEHIFYCLRSVMADGAPHGSLLLDHLYFLKSDAEQKAKSKRSQPTLCSSLVCSTSFLRHLAGDPVVSSGKRGQAILEFFASYREETKHFHPPTAPRRKKMAKGKGKADPNEEVHIHRASQISQVHDLFPDLSNHYILRLLDHFHDDNEAVIAALLEPESLPGDLRDQDSQSELAVEITGPAHDLAPRTTPPLPAQRRSVFDGDDFDRLRISSDRLHRGRKELSLNQADNQDEHTQRKAAIMSALAAFDSDDDERDDTYDVADVGGSVDATLDTDDRPRREKNPDQNPHEETLFRAWRDNQDFFNRDSKTRISMVRQGLKRDTGMSDEQIEGWAIMLKKDPGLQNRLEKKYSAAQTHRGNQNVLDSTRWQGNNTPEDSEGDGGGGTGGRRMGQAQIRGNRTWGRGGRGGRGGGSTAGPSDDAATQAARRRKEQGRGRGGASHNRREGRARKMGRGMAGAVQP